MLLKSFKSIFTQWISLQSISPVSKICWEDRWLYVTKVRQKIDSVCWSLNNWGEFYAWIRNFLWWEWMGSDLIQWNSILGTNLFFWSPSCFCFKMWMYFLILHLYVSILIQNTKPKMAGQFPLKIMEIPQTHYSKMFNHLRSNAEHSFIYFINIFHLLK